MDIVIRQATIDDLESILLLSDELTISDLPYDKEVNIEWAHTNKGKEYYEQKIKEQSGICFVAEYNGKIIGYLTAAIKEVPSYRLVKVSDLENLVVNKEFRNKGIGKQLLSKFLEWSKDQNVNKVSVSVFSSNEKGIAFYLREGFTPYDTTLEMALSGTK